MKATNDTRSDVLHCTALIAKAISIVALTGAGISTSAGIPDFRGPHGLYVTRRYDPDTVFDINYFLRDPKPFFDFSRDFLHLESTIQPTFTHRFLTKLESIGKLTGVITQNIDGLHTKALTKNVLEVHGGYQKSFCLDCGQEFSFSKMKEKIFKEDVPRCHCGGVVKPDVVFFGENVKYLNEAYDVAEKADLFFVIGSSCVVQPAASIPTATHGKIVVVNQGDVDLYPADVVLTAKEDINRFFEGVADQLGYVAR